MSKSHANPTCNVPTSHWPTSTWSCPSNKRHITGPTHSSHVFVPTRIHSWSNALEFTLQKPATPNLSRPFVVHVIHHHWLFLLAPCPPPTGTTCYFVFLMWQTVTLTSVAILTPCAVGPTPENATLSMSDWRVSNRVLNGTVGLSSPLGVWKFMHQQNHNNAATTFIAPN